MVSEKRFGHIRGVADTAVSLAQRYGADPKKAELAGYLHDAMRGKNGEQLMAMAEEYDIAVDDYTKEHPDLLHGPVSAAWAKCEYGIKDEQILEAIRAHTVGDEDMDKLTCILFLSDAMEPGRRHPGAEALRTLAKEDLYRATLLALDQSGAYLTDRGKIPHPITESARKALLMKIEEEKHE